MNAAQAVSRAGAPGRDARIDAIRGLALVMIFINHLPGNPLERLTSRNFGFTDAAEIFVLLAGVSAALAYGRYFGPAEGRVWLGLWRCWGRAWTLYMAHLVISVLVIGLAMAMLRFAGDPAMLTRDNFSLLMRDPVGVLIGLPALTHHFGYIDILPLYVVLLLVAPGLLWLGRRSAPALLLLSVGIWLWAGLTRTNFPGYPGTGPWFLNPFSWQLIFTTGLLTGLSLRDGRRLVPARPWLVALAAGWLVLSLLWLRIPAVRELCNAAMVWIAQMGAPRLFTNFHKGYVELPRLLHLLALAYCASVLPGLARVSAARLAAPLRAMGRQSLAVFAFGTVLSFALRAFHDFKAAGAFWSGLGLTFGGIVALALLALAREKIRRMAAQEPRRSA
ncbi:OpgC family protein [Pseudogemmobacter sonorensis]|uniref:OpgC family protein n=1 Tax=Pseudogemmobacter sonorensis TaxID=2989681 RepID=UPI0036AF991B